MKDLFPTCLFYETTDWHCRGWSATEATRALVELPGRKVPLFRKVSHLGPGIDEFLSFVISENSPFVILFDDVIGIDGDFPATAGSIHDKLRDGVTTGVTAQAFDDFDSLRDRSAEV